MLALIIWGGIFAVIFYLYAIRPLSYWRERGVQQSNPAWLVGDNLGTFLGTQNIADMIQMVYNLYYNARYVGFYQFMLPTLLIKDPELLKQITVKDFDHFVDHRSFVPENTDPLWSKNIFSLKGQRWRDMRPILSPSFTSSKMRSIFVLMSECADTFVKHFSNKNQERVDVEMKDVLTRFGNDVIATSAFGIKVDSLAEPKNEFYMMGKEATDFTGFWKSMKLLGFMFFPKLWQILKMDLFSKELSKFFYGLVDETIRVREEKGIVRPDMIHLLMEARKGKVKNEEKEMIDTGFATVQEASIEKANGLNKQIEITNMDIAAQAMIFFFAGFDSVTTMMSFMAYELVINPDIQDRMRKEINDTLKECGGKLTYEALMKMKYMDMVVSESLRKWPSAIVADRVCTKPYTIKPTTPDESTLHLDKGTVLWMPIMGIHHDPKYYPDPEKFDPERFNEENRGKIDPYTYLPFGLGPRNCIGSRFALLEAKTLFFHLLNNFEIVPTEKTIIPIKLSKKTFSLIAEGGCNLGFKPIKA